METAKDSVAETHNVQRIITDIDNLISEILQVRRRVAALAEDNQTERTLASVRDAEWFGMWSDREDMQGLSSREWLPQLRAQQWGR
ncbi:MAG: hypothetical protein ACREOI_11200 [bacterium]